jgi:hypothetical protein
MSRWRHGWNILGEPKLCSVKPRDSWSADHKAQTQGDSQPTRERAVQLSHPKGLVSAEPIGIKTLALGLDRWETKGCDVTCLSSLS